MCGHICIYIYIYTVYTHDVCIIHVCMYVCLSVCLCVRACVRAWVCVYIRYMHVNDWYTCWKTAAGSWHFLAAQQTKKNYCTCPSILKIGYCGFISSIIPIIYMAKDKSTRLSYTKGGSLWVTAELRNSRSATCATSASAVASPHSEGSLMNGGHLIHWQIVKFVTWKSDLSTHTGCDRDDTNGEWSTLSWGSKTIVYIIGCKLCLAPTPLWYVTGFYMSVCVSENQQYPPKCPFQ